MKEHMTETVNTLLDAAVTATDAEEAGKYANAAKTVVESYKMLEETELETKKWYDLSPREIALNNKDKVVEGMKLLGGIVTAIVGGYLGYKASEHKNETIKYGVNAATNFSQTDVLNGKPLEVVDRATKIADD